MHVVGLLLALPGADLEPLADDITLCGEWRESERWATSHAIQFDPGPFDQTVGR